MVFTQSDHKDYVSHTKLIKRVSSCVLKCWNGQYLNGKHCCNTGICLWASISLHSWGFGFSRWHLRQNSGSNLQSFFGITDVATLSGLLYFISLDLDEIMKKKWNNGLISIPFPFSFPERQDPLLNFGKNFLSSTICQQFVKVDNLSIVLSDKFPSILHFYLLLTHPEDIADT